MTIPANPVEYLFFHAKLQPDNVAMQDLVEAMTWRSLAELVRAVAYKLRRSGIQPRQVVLTHLRSSLDWILNLALTHEAVTTCSIFGAVPTELHTADFVLTSEVLPNLREPKTILVDGAWLKDLPAVPDNFKPRPYAGDDSLFRLVLTSGTTGQSKAAEFSLGTFLKRCRGGWALPYATELCMMGQPTVTGFSTAWRNLCRGVPNFYANNLKEIIRLVNAHHIECLSGSPHQLIALIDEMQQTSQRLSSLQLVWYGGGEASPTLVDHMRRDLCPTVICLYGSTEVGLVSEYLVHEPKWHPGKTGYVHPEAEVQIVDQAHKPLGVGETGTVRVRSPNMITRYYKNPEETDRSFRDGWFYPGDVGRLLENGMLELSGRESELINRGGNKVYPGEIDQVIRNYEGIVDAASFGFENHLGVEDICAAVVVAKDFMFEPFQKHLAQVLPSYKNPSLIIRADKIPRNQMGKPMRHELRKGYENILRERLRAAQYG